MKFQGILIILMLAAALGGSAMAQTTSDTAFSQVVVTRVVLDPQVPMVGDTGTITVTVQNTGTEAVEINRATLYADGINLLNAGAYDSLITLGPGNTRDFTFFVTATGQPGLYQPRFYLDFLGSGFLSYLIPLRIDNTPLQVSVVSTPDFFASGRDDQVVLRIGNPRGSNLTSITITPSGTGV
ncbi:MAG TPA: CARDB domain-containing protein, partial [Methanomicrobiales archaeon]|nr:CARDB domain-containing protein [Methanomicrobiales archaeon]